jgi:hypothetical protein
MAGIITLSWTGSIFFSTLENYIPNTMPRVKIVVSGAKFVTSFPIRTVEWTSNQIFGFVENIIVGSPLPTNITDVYRLNIGPKLENLKNLRKPVITWLLKQLQD